MAKLKGQRDLSASEHNLWRYLNAGRKESSSLSGGQPLHVGMLQ